MHRAEKEVLRTAGLHFPKANEALVDALEKLSRPDIRCSDMSLSVQTRDILAEKRERERRMLRFVLDCPGSCTIADGPPFFAAFEAVAREAGMTGHMNLDREDYLRNLSRQLYRQFPEGLSSPEFVRTFRRYMALHDLPIEEQKKIVCDLSDEEVLNRAEQIVAKEDAEGKKSTLPREQRMDLAREEVKLKVEEEKSAAIVRKYAESEQGRFDERYLCLLSSFNYLSQGNPLAAERPHFAALQTFSNLLEALYRMDPDARAKYEDEHKRLLSFLEGDPQTGAGGADRSDLTSLGWVVGLEAEHQYHIRPARWDGRAPAGQIGVDSVITHYQTMYRLGRLTELFAVKLEDIEKQVEDKKIDAAQAERLRQDAYRRTWDILASSRDEVHDSAQTIAARSIIYGFDSQTGGETQSFEGLKGEDLTAFAVLQEQRYRQNAAVRAKRSEQQNQLFRFDVTTQGYTPYPSSEWLRDGLERARRDTSVQAPSRAELSAMTDEQLAQMAASCGAGYQKAEQFADKLEYELRHYNALVANLEWVGTGAVSLAAAQNGALAGCVYKDQNGSWRASDRLKDGVNVWWNRMFSHIGGYTASQLGAGPDQIAKVLDEHVKRNAGLPEGQRRRLLEMQLNFTQQYAEILPSR